MFIASCSLLLSSALPAFPQGTNELDCLRVYVIQPACFEYVLTSTMDKEAGKKMLSFNHINGRTVFAGEGDAVGEYTVKSFEPSVERTFNPTINSYVEKKSGRVKLQAPDGTKVTLEMGKILPRPGWIACLIWIDSGSWMYVSRDEVIPVGSNEVMVASITADSLAVVSGNASNNVPMITDAEKDQLVAMWEARKKAAEEVRLAEKKRQIEQAEKEAAAEAAKYLAQLDSSSGARKSRQIIDIRTPPQFYYGTEYRYPISFETVPIIEKTSTGTRIRNAIVVPTRFQTGFWGNQITSGGTGARVISVTQ